MNQRKEQTYITPQVEVMLIEVEQNILGASTEEIGGENPEQPWEK